MFDTELRCGNTLVRPDFTAFRREHRAFASALCDMLEMPPHKRRVFIDQFVEKAVIQMGDALVAMYGTEGTLR